MCDYSASAARQRPAVKKDRLVTGLISQHTRGFTPIGDPTTAVCLLPGTELRFDKPVQAYSAFGINGHPVEPKTTTHTNARFRQVDKNDAHTHHDTLEFPDGTKTKLNMLVEGQTATVFQLPAPARTRAEVKEQRRAAYV